MKKINKQLTLCLLVVAVIGLQQVIMVGAIAPPPVEPPPGGGGTVTYRMYGCVKQSGTSLQLIGATVKFYGNGVTFLGSTTTNNYGYFNYYKSLTTCYNYVKAVVTKSGYQSASKIDYVSSNVYYFGNIYLTQLLTHNIMGFVDNDETSNPVAGVEVLIYASTGGVGGSFTYVGTTTTDSNGFFTKTILAPTRYNAIFIDMSKDNYYDKTAMATGTTSFYFGTVEMHEYQKIGVFFWVNPGYGATDEEVLSTLNGYQTTMENEGFTKFFYFKNTADFESDFNVVKNYERQHDVVFLYTFSHGDDSGWLELDGDKTNNYAVQVLEVIVDLESLDSNKVGWIVTACFAGNAYDEALSRNSEIFLITSSDDEISQFYCEGSGYTEEPDKCAFAYPFFDLIASGYNADDAYNIARYETQASYYTLQQYPRMYNGLVGYTFFA